MSRDALLARAPAKLNLALAVGPPRDDGMHPIASWMVTVDLCDELLVTRLPVDRLSRYALLWHADARRPSEIDWSITADLSVRAHLALEQHVGRRLPVQLKLEKRIPVGGGLGGGSSNAAAMLHALDRLFALELETAELAAVGATLGADVPFLVHGGSAIVEGLGERVFPHDVTPDLHVAIALPPLGCDTGAVYRSYDALEPATLRDEAVRVLATGDPPPPDALFNDLTPAAIRTQPALEEVLARFGELAERPAHLSGSGSSVFVLCDDERHARRLASAFERTHDIPTVATRTTAGTRDLRTKVERAEDATADRV